MKLVLLALVLTISTKASELVLVTLDGCAPCKTMKARLDEMKVTYTTSNPTDMQTKSAPILIVIEKNREKKRLAGLKTVEEIKLFLEGK